MHHRLLFVLLCLCAALGCSNLRPEHIWDDRYIEATARHDEGAYEAASAHYAQLLKHAPDEDAARLIRYRQALLAQDTGRKEQALKAYRALYEADVVDEHGARALSKASDLVTQQDQRAQLKQRLAARYPQTIDAEHALEWLRHWARQQGTSEQYLSWLRQLQPKFKGSDLEDHALFTQALVLEEDLKRPDDALAQYKAVYDSDPQGSLADDALWRMASAYEALGKWKSALVWLERVSQDNETSWFIGTYASEFADDARLRMGWIYKNKLKDYDRAAKQYRVFLEEFPDSRLADDAAWQLVELKRLSGAEDYARARAQFLKSYPHSRFARDAQGKP